MGCGAPLVKIILFVANVIFALAGLGLAGIGTAWLVFVEAGHLAIAAIVVGAVAILMAFFGCCGAIVESKTMLVIYSVLLIILMNLKTALATVLYMATETLVAAINDTLKTLFANSAPSFHEIEKSFGCCGTTGALSYVNSLRAIPATCCTERLCIPTNSSAGCVGVVDDLIRNCSVGVAALCIALAALELVLVIFGLCLADHVGNKYKGRY
ncbi:23 kDa integral membrane protein-like [Choristoneura fumiferana]|uniref:23 kDa integral membrane protein-like n=1 Tax=Choristoneura fumiferana TaxID=7141 RepID=UPI003D15A2D8